MTTVQQDFGPLWRKTDPDTSKVAAERMVRTGKCQQQRDLILEAVRARPGMTPRGIARMTKLDYHAVQRRLHEIKEIEPRGERSGCRCWWPKAVSP